MGDPRVEKSVLEMSHQELEREIAERTRRYDLAADPQIGVAIVTAFPLDQKRPAIVRSGRSSEAVLRELLRTLRMCG